jgi:hypothetical protein
MGIQGDVLNSDILQSLKIGAVDTSNSIFKLFGNISPAIFWVSSAIVIASTYIGSPIKCTNGISSGDEFVESTCWIHGTYYIPEEINKDINNGDYCGRPYEERTKEGSEDTGNPDTAYYQWVPFMLFIHGMIFFISANMWNFLENGLLEQFGTRSKMISLVNEKEIQKLAEQNAGKFSALSSRRNYRYFLKYIACEAGNILALIFNFYILDIFLGGRFLTYGSDVVSYSMNKAANQNHPMCSAFPTLTSCDVSLGSVVARKADNRNFQCVLSQNIINQKIYLAIWFWMLILVIACVHNTVYRIATILVPALRRQELVWLINTKRRQEEFLDKEKNKVREYWSENWKIGNWFLLCQIGRNSNSYYFRQFLEALNDQSKDNNISSDHADDAITINVEDALVNGSKQALLGADYFREFLQTLMDNNRRRDDNYSGMRNRNIEEGLCNTTKKPLLGESCN